MLRKNTLLGLILALSAVFAVGASAQTTTPAPAKPKAVAKKKMHAVPKVVFQVSDNDPAKWNLALNNAKNVLQEYGAGKAEIEIVAYGPGIGMLKAEATTADRISEATLAGVKIVACENTMNAQKLTKADMNPAIGYVPAGVVELMKRQGEGWAYIRP